MEQSLSKILPPIIIFFIGYFLKRSTLLKKDDANLFLRLCFYIGFPSVYLLSIPQITLSLTFISIIVAPFLIIMLTYVLSFITSKSLKLKGKSQGVFLLSTMLLNGTFVFPFFLALYGIEGAARYSFIDASAGIVVFTFVYFIACLYGENTKELKFVIKKVFLAPPLWAIAVALIINMLHVKLSPIVTNTLEDLSNLVTPLFMLSLGIHFHFAFSKFRVIIPATLIRSAFGLLIGFLVTLIFHVTGITRSILLVYAAAPVGLNTLVFSTLEKLDNDLAANIISFSVFLGIFYIPLLLLLTK